MRKYFEFYNPTKINCGEGALRTIGAELEYFGSKKPFVIAAVTAVRMGAADKVRAALRGSSVKESLLFDALPAKLDLDVLRELKAKFLAEKCDGIVAVGGESAMDFGKGLKLFLSDNCDDFLPIAGTSKRSVKDIPLIAVPTENGSGHETMGYVESGDCYVSTPGVIPNVLILDERVAALAPARVTAANGVYALANAIEAYIGADGVSLVETYAQKAVELIFKNLENLVKDEENSGDALAVALASAYAGIAYGNVPFGAAHALAEALSDVTGQPMEEMIAICLAPSLKNLSDPQKAKLEALLPFMCGIDKCGEIPQAERSAKCIEVVENLISSLHAASGMPEKIKETKISREIFGAIADAAQDKRAAITELRPIGQEEFLKILNEAY